MGGPSRVGTVPNETQQCWLLQSYFQNFSHAVVIYIIYSSHQLPWANHLQLFIPLIVMTSHATFASSGSDETSPITSLFSHSTDFILLRSLPSNFGCSMKAARPSFNYLLTLLKLVLLDKEFHMNCWYLAASFLLFWISIAKHVSCYKPPHSHSPDHSTYLCSQ